METYEKFIDTMGFSYFNFTHLSLKTLKMTMNKRFLNWILCITLALQNEEQFFCVIRILNSQIILEQLSSIGRGSKKSVPWKSVAKLASLQ